MMANLALKETLDDTTLCTLDATLDKIHEFLQSLDPLEWSEMLSASDFVGDREIKYGLLGGDIVYQDCLIDIYCGVNVRFWDEDNARLLTTVFHFDQVFNSNVEGIE